MQELPVVDLSAREAYRLMTDLVAPRPIAWVSTVDAKGRANLAPFSYYQAVCSDPPTLVLGLASRADGRPKDTLANLLETGELTINHVSEALGEAMSASSVSYAPEVSEWEACGVEAAPAQLVQPARVALAHGGFEGRLTHAIPMGRTKHGGPSSTLVVIEVVHVWIEAALFERDEGGRLRAIPPAKLGALARLGGNAYTTTAGAFELLRPPAPSKS